RDSRPWPGREPRPPGAPRRRRATRVTAPRPPPPGTLTDTPFCAGQVGRRPVPSWARLGDVPYPPGPGRSTSRSTFLVRIVDQPRGGAIPGPPFPPGAGWATSRSTFLVRIFDHPRRGALPGPRSVPGQVGRRPVRHSWYVTSIILAVC